jgi:hypothetical protein
MPMHSPQPGGGRHKVEALQEVPVVQSASL